LNSLDHIYNFKGVTHRKVFKVKSFEFSMKGEVKKFDFNARTLDDPAVRDGLEAVSVLNELEPYFLVGGIASQSYLPTRCRRPTSDIDFAMVRPLSKPDFRGMVGPVEEYLKGVGYKTDLHINNRSRSFALSYSRPEEGERLCLEFVRRNRQSFDRHKKRLEREFNNCKKKIIEGRERTYRVTCPEDIAVPKLVRMINSLKRNPEFAYLVPPRREPLSDALVIERIDEINGMREEAMFNPGDPYLAERLRFISDIYDIRILSEITGFNEDYFTEAESDWRDIGTKIKLRNKIFTMALPEFLHESN
jgi:hypothetical protein